MLIAKVHVHRQVVTTINSVCGDEIGQGHFPKTRVKREFKFAFQQTGGHGLEIREAYSVTNLLPDAAHRRHRAQLVEHIYHPQETTTNRPHQVIVLGVVWWPVFFLFFGICR